MFHSSRDKQKQVEGEKEMKGELPRIERKESKNKTGGEQRVSVVLYWWLISLRIARLNCGDLERFLNK